MLLVAILHAIAAAAVAALIALGARGWRRQRQAWQEVARRHGGTLTDIQRPLWRSGLSLRVELSGVRVEVEHGASARQMTRARARILSRPGLSFSVSSPGLALWSDGATCGLDARGRVACPERLEALLTLLATIARGEARGADLVPSVERLRRQ